MEVKEPAVDYGKRKYTIAEYLEMEEAATEKHEYYQGGFCQCLVLKCHTLLSPQI